MKYKILIVFAVAMTIFYTSLLIVGCGAMNTQRLAKAVDDTRAATTIICSTAEQFAAQGVDIPGIEKCDTILPLLSVQELDVVVQILNCANESPVKSVEFVECATKAGWPQLKKRLEHFDK